MVREKSVLWAFLEMNVLAEQCKGLPIESEGADSDSSLPSHHEAPPEHRHSDFYPVPVPAPYVPGVVKD